MEKVDVIVIGSGQGGVPFAVEQAKQGKEVVVFERKAWGGSCINYGCTPSKILLSAAHTAERSRRADRLGIHADVRVDFPAVMERLRNLVDSFEEGVEERLADAGVRLVQGEASFTGKRQLSGGGVEVEAPLVVINTGKSPFIPPVDGLQDVPYMTYIDFWKLDSLPERMLVMGAGYTGLELGQSMAELGSEVHIVEMMERPVVNEEEDVSRQLQEALEENGVHFYLGKKATQVDYQDGVFTVTLDDGQKLEGDALLVSTGRKANTEALNVEASGIELDDKGNVKVDEQFHTTCEGVYAIGDVTGQPAFTHVSWEDYRRLTDILQGGERKQGDRPLAYAFFTDPQVGRAGLTLEDAEEQGINARVETMPLSHVARASETGRTRGFYRMVVDRDTDKIIGATLVGPQTAELIHVFVAHIERGSTWQDLDRSMHIHPSFAEGLPSLARKFKQE